MKTKELTLSAMFLAIGQILPFITGQIPQIGAMLSPMHFPIFLCAFICGPKYALIVGFICPLLRGMLFNMPVLFPNGIAMAFELATYGFITGFIYNKFKEKNLVNIYISLIVGMLVGRVVWGVVQAILMSVSGAEAFTFAAFITRGFVNAVPGIIAQLILIPLIVNILNKRRTA